MSLPTEKRDLLIEDLAGLIERKGVAAPAILFLEANKPLSFVASQAFLMVQPLINLAMGGRMPADVSLLLEDRATVDLLISRLERGRG